MNRYKETFETWNKLAVLYQARFMDLDLYNETYDFICNALEAPNSRILDVGCGPGNITKYLLANRPDFDILGIDIAPNMIKLAKANNPAASFEVFDIRQLSDMQATYDGIVCGFCLPYLSPEDTTKFITDSHKLLNVNGLLYISFVDGDPMKSDFQSGNNGDRTYFYFHNLDDLKILLLKNEFEELKTFSVRYLKTDTEADIHTILTARKKGKA